MTSHLRFEVTGHPPGKNEARSMLAHGHPHRDRVVRLLEAARDAMTTAGVAPFGPADSIGLEVVVRRPASVAGDATNCLGGIGDVLQSSRVGADVAHLGDLAAVHVYPDDKQIHEINYRLEDHPESSYLIHLWLRPSG